MMPMPYRRLTRTPWRLLSWRYSNSGLRPANLVGCLSILLISVCQLTLRSGDANLAAALEVEKSKVEQLQASAILV
jgi:hypothetical protein